MGNLEPISRDKEKNRSFFEALTSVQENSRMKVVLDSFFVFEFSLFSRVALSGRAERPEPEEDGGFHGDGIVWPWGWMVT